MKLESLKDLYLEQLRDLYSAETQLVEALPRMVEAAHNPALQKTFGDHLRQTQEHIERLDRIFRDLGQSPKGHTCEGMQGLIREGQQMIRTRGAESVLDAGLIACAQRIEHYEIAGYGTVRTYAELLGRAEHVRLLERTLQEEEETDEKLALLADVQVLDEAWALTP
jgi:ferritin-like metal-binding protein YciE